MPLKLNVGISKKVGLPDYGSLAASCHVELELDQALLQADLAGFHERVQKTFVACRQAVNDELALRQANGRQAAEQLAADGSRGTRAEGNGRSNGHANGRQARNGHQASAKQLDYAEQLAKQIRGLGTRRLEELAQKLFGKPVAGLSGLDASSLIDTLKAIKAGEIDIDQVFNGTAS